MSLVSIYIDVSFNIVSMVTAPLMFLNIEQIIYINIYVDSLSRKFCSLDLYPYTSSHQINNSYIFASFNVFYKERKKILQITNLKPL